MVLNWHNDRSGCMYTSGTLEANWWEERVQNSSGTNVGLRAPDRAHHEPPPDFVLRDRDPSMSAPLNGGLDVLTCYYRQPEGPSRTMHLKEAAMDYATTAKEGISWPTEKDSHRSSDHRDVQKLKELNATKMIGLSTFSEAGRGRASTIQPEPVQNPVSDWRSSTSDMMVDGIKANHPSKAKNAHLELTQKPTLTEVRGGFEKSITNRLAIFPRIGGLAPGGTASSQVREHTSLLRARTPRTCGATRC